MNNKKNVLNAIAHLFLVCGAGMPLVMQADDFVWTGAVGDNKWETAGNWSMNGTPATSVPNTSKDSVLFRDSNATSAPIHVDIGSTFDIGTIQYQTKNTITINILKNATTGIMNNIITDPSVSSPIEFKIAGILNIPVSISNNLIKISGSGKIGLSKNLTIGTLSENVYFEILDDDRAIVTIDNSMLHEKKMIYRGQLAAAQGANENQTLCLNLLPDNTFITDTTAAGGYGAVALNSGIVQLKTTAFNPDALWTLGASGNAVVDASNLDATKNVAFAGLESDLNKKYNVSVVGRKDGAALAVGDSTDKIYTFQGAIQEIPALIKTGSNTQKFVFLAENKPLTTTFTRTEKSIENQGSGALIVSLGVDPDVAVSNDLILAGDVHHSGSGTIQFNLDGANLKTGQHLAMTLDNVTQEKEKTGHTEFHLTHGAELHFTGHTAEGAHIAGDASPQADGFHSKWIIASDISVAAIGSASDVLSPSSPDLGSMLDLSFAKDDTVSVTGGHTHMLYNGAMYNNANQKIGILSLDLGHDAKNKNYTFTAGKDAKSMLKEIRVISGTCVLAPDSAFGAHSDWILSGKDTVIDLSSVATKSLITTESVLLTQQASITGDVTASMVMVHNDSVIDGSVQAQYVQMDEGSSISKDIRIASGKTEHYGLDVRTGGTIRGAITTDQISVSNAHPFGTRSLSNDGPVNVDFYIDDPSQTKAALELAEVNFKKLNVRVTSAKIEDILGQKYTVIQSHTGIDTLSVTVEGIGDLRGYEPILTQDLVGLSLFYPKTPSSAWIGFYGDQMNELNFLGHRFREHIGNYWMNSLYSAYGASGFWLLPHYEHTVFSSETRTKSTANNYGGILGYTATLNTESYLGLALALDHFQIKNEPKDQTAKGNLWQLGIYGWTQLSRTASLGGAVTYGVTNAISNERSKAVATWNSEYNTYLFSGSVRLVFNVFPENNAIAVRPYLGFAHQTLGAPATFSEISDTSRAKLLIAMKTQHSNWSQLGLFFQTELTRQASISGTAAWNHNFSGSGTQLYASFFAEGDKLAYSDVLGANYGSFSFNVNFGRASDAQTSFYGQLDVAKNIKSYGGGLKFSLPLA